MNWKVILTAGALSILPLSINAAESNPINQNRELELMGHPTQIANRGDRGQKMERMLQQLNLTDEQSQQIETIKEQSQTAARELKEQLQTQRQEMQTLMKSDAAKEEIREQHQVAQSLRQQLENERFETMLEIRDILTQEQRAAMAELMDSYRGRIGPRS